MYISLSCSKNISVKTTMMITSVIVCLSAVLVVAGNVAKNDSWVVHTKQGPVRGYRDPEGDIFSFYNIPYATAPTGVHKFKAPLPPPTWLDPLEAVDMGVKCPQYSNSIYVAPDSNMQEDCLIANVFVPDTETKNLPVLVVIHGGAFQLGYGNGLKGKNLIRTKEMIIVTFNYRLGIHGFLCLGTKKAPGNAGMKDQVALLRWVKNNIGRFGGNPDDVTISGYSAGSASVDLLMLSKSARGLFKRVIPESGSNLSAFTVQVDPIENARFFARNNNFTDVDDVKTLERFYTSASFDLLTSDMFYDRTDSTFVFTPCVERDTGAEVFLDDAPLNILKSGDYDRVPMLYGFANMEGLLRAENFDIWKTQINEKFSDFLPADLEFDSDEQKDQVANTVKEFYFGTEPIDESNILAYVQYFTDALFSIPTLKSTQVQVEGGHDQIYLYEYSFVDEDTPFVPYTNVRGADHCAQTMAVYTDDDETASEEYKKMKSIMREIWSNFITTGKPVPEGSSLPAWPAVKAKWSPYMSLGQTVEIREALLEREVDFWDGIYYQHYRRPAPPSPFLARQ